MKKILLILSLIIIGCDGDTQVRDSDIKPEDTSGVHFRVDPDVRFRHQELN